MQFRVASVTEAGTDRVTVTLTEVSGPPTGPVAYGAPGMFSSVNLGLSIDEATDAGYFPGRVFDVTIKASK